MSENLAELCSCVLWKVQLVDDYVGYLFEETSKQRVEGAAWCLLPAYSKVWEEKEKWRKESLNNREPELKDLEHSLPDHLVKNEKLCFREGKAGQSLHEEIMGIHKFKP